MILITTAAGFVVARPESIDLALLAVVVTGTALVAAGTNALNEYIERDVDALMERTRNRPLPAGRLDSVTALSFSLLTIAAGLLWLTLIVNPLCAALAVVTTIVYLAVYTPLKRVTSISTIIGAIPGALPPMIGWAGATGSLSAGAWALFALLAIWQLPHFLAIGFMYREDYRKGGFRMLSLGDQDGKTTSLSATLFALTLIPLGLLLPLAGVGGPIAGLGAAAAAVWFSASAWRFFRETSRGTARRLFMSSNFYLLIVMSLIVAGSLI